MERSKKMVSIAIKAMEDKKAEDIKIINIGELSSIGDYFIIASGSNINQVHAIVDNIDEQLHKAGFPCKQVEGYDAGNWILMDYGDIIVHVFDRDNRLFYNLERIWRDGKDEDLDAFREEA